MENKKSSENIKIGEKIGEKSEKSTAISDKQRRMLFRLKNALNMDTDDLYALIFRETGKGHMSHLILIPN